MPWRVRRRIEPWLPTYRGQYHRVPKDDLLGSRALLEDFLAAIREGKPAATSAEEGVGDLMVIEAAYQSIACGRPVGA